VQQITGIETMHIETEHAEISGVDNHCGTDGIHGSGS
jgi:hypothetical protein